MLYKNIKDLIENIAPAVSISKEKIKILDEKKLKEKILDELVSNITLSTNEETKKACHWIIWQLAQNFGIYPSSIHEFYMARGREEFKDLTVPAINLRGYTYESARALMRPVVKKNIGAFIFELARSEIKYTNQSPAEYASVVLAAAIKEGFRGPIFIQLDHGQINLKKYEANPEEEIKNLKDLMRESIEVGFYNIDIDTSTLVDLSQSTTLAQQEKNFEVAGQLTQFIRELSPEGITISVGGEIGEIGKKNSTPEELRAFMKGYSRTLHGDSPLSGTVPEGLSKISVQSGATHGGVVLPDGTIQKVDIDFRVLEELGKIARSEYGLGGVVQHGASTLPDEFFHKFPKTQTLEIHLATGFQNIILDHEAFPSKLREKMYAWLNQNCAGERSQDWTDEQFYYKLRKKAWGPFKKELGELPQKAKEKISQTLEERFEFLLEKLNVGNTKELVAKYTKP